MGLISHSISLTFWKNSLCRFSLAQSSLIFPYDHYMAFILRHFCFHGRDFNYAPASWMCSICFLSYFNSFWACTTKKSCHLFSFLIVGWLRHCRLKAFFFSNPSTLLYDLVVFLAIEKLEVILTHKSLLLSFNLCSLFGTFGYNIPNCHYVSDVN